MSEHDDFFNGLSPEMPKLDRRVFLGSGLALTAAAGGLGAAIGLAQRAYSPGTWDQAEQYELSGVVTASPFPLLRTADLDGTPRTVLLSCLGKCGVAPRLGSYANQPVLVRGSLIARGPHAMIAVIDGPDWIEPLSAAPASELAFGEMAEIGPADLNGEILDTKCWFGAMSPAEGKPHKACAALCIRGGLPPALYLKDASRERRLTLLVDADGGAHGDDLLPLVADPVRVSGRLYRRDDLIYFRAGLSRIRRLS